MLKSIDNILMFHPLPTRKIRLEPYSINIFPHLIHLLPCNFKPFPIVPCILLIWYFIMISYCWFWLQLLYLDKFDLSWLLFVILTQPKHTWEEEISLEELPLIRLADEQVCRSIFLSFFFKLLLLFIVVREMMREREGNATPG